MKDRKSLDDTHAHYHWLLDEFQMMWLSFFELMIKKPNMPYSFCSIYIRIGGLLKENEIKLKKKKRKKKHKWCGKMFNQPRVYDDWFLKEILFVCLFFLCVCVGVSSKR